MKCPNCNETLVMSERSGVEIDYCPNCRGVWLDRGELDKIIERSAPAAQNTSSSDNYSQNPNYSDKHYDNKRKKKDSFLSDLFDF